VSKRKIVFVCSPLARSTAAEDTDYARAAVRDSLLRGESPVCPHLLYPLALDDSTEHRQLGMAAGFALLEGCSVLALYVDRGIGRGMRMLLDQAKGLALTIERRRLGAPPVATDMVEREEPRVRMNSIDIG
jgi:hypothetical protein